MKPVPPPPAPDLRPVSPTLLERMAKQYDDRFLNRLRPKRKYHE